MPGLLRTYEYKDTWWKANYRRCARKGEYSIDVVGALFHESCRRSIPRNPNRLIDLKQSITLSGVGIAQFESAVKGLLVIYQMFEAEVARTGNKLRPWQTRRDSDDLVLHFANRILTSRKDAGEEEAVDLESVIDPLNILRPLLRGEVHLQDNVVEYWEQRLQAPSQFVTS